MESYALEKMLSIRVLDLVVIRVGDVICGRSKLKYINQENLKYVSIS